MAKFQKGKKRPKNAGRKLGSKNKIPLAAKEAVHQALNSGDGAVAYLLKLKNSKIATDRQAFIHLVGRLIPREITGNLDLMPPGVKQVHIYLPDNGRGPDPVPAQTKRAGRGARRPPLRP